MNRITYVSAWLDHELQSSDGRRCFQTFLVVLLHNVPHLKTDAGKGTPSCPDSSSQRLPAHFLQHFFAFERGQHTAPVWEPWYRGSTANSNQISTTHRVLLGMLDLLSFFSAHKLRVRGTSLVQAHSTGCCENPKC